MTTPSNRSVPVGSERFRLARLARDAALRVPGVVGTDPGPVGLIVTADGRQRLEGVTCVASKGDGYDVSLCLVCDLVPLPELGRQVQAAVRQAASRAGIPLESVSMHVPALAGAGYP